MAHRSTHKPNDAMTEAQLRELRRSLSLLSPQIVREKYKVVMDRCRFYDLATPRMMQELVTLWKILWQWRK
jgi:hypothetical protein